MGSTAFVSCFRFVATAQRNFFVEGRLKIDKKHCSIEPCYFPIEQHSERLGPGSSMKRPAFYL